MILAVIIDTSKGTLKSSVEEICECYQLTLLTNQPVIEFANECRALFFADLPADKMENVDALEADAQVIDLSLDAVFHYQLKENKSKEGETLINNLNRLFKDS